MVRFIHLGPGIVSKIHTRTNLKNKIKIPSDRPICEVCNITKMTEKTNKELSARKEGLLEEVSLDIAGPFLASWCGNKFFLQIVDSATHRIWSIPMKTKDQALVELPKWKAVVELESWKKVLSAKTDNAPELLKIFAEWANSDGILVKPTVVATSHQNRGAERQIRTGEEAMRAMLKEAGLPLEFCDEAVKTHAYTFNRISEGPMKDGKYITHHEAWYNQVPEIDHIRKWGSKCYSYANPKTLPAKEHHDKLVDRGKVRVFVGYVDATTKQYRIYASDLGYVVRRTTVKIDENTPGDTIPLQLRGLKPQGTSNNLPTRRPVGRPRKNPLPAAPLPAKAAAIPIPPANTVPEGNADNDMPADADLPGFEPQQEEEAYIPEEKEKDTSTEETTKPQIQRILQTSLYFQRSKLQHFPIKSNTFQQKYLLQKQWYQRTNISFVRESESMYMKTMERMSTLKELGRLLEHSLHGYCIRKRRPRMMNSPSGELNMMISTSLSHTKKQSTIQTLLKNGKKPLQKSSTPSMQIILGKRLFPRREQIWSHANGYSESNDEQMGALRDSKLALLLEASLKSTV